tara:strand:+ start:1654 stop:2826 length:1173 start_codon:yes stop_codon:yes gene_type:complete
MKKIAILGSTGSIGSTTLKIVRKNKKNFKVQLLSTNSNVKKIFKQAKEFKVKNVIILDKKKIKLWKSQFKKNNIKIYDNFEISKKNFNNKLDFVMNGISGIEGLEPTLKIIKHTKKIGIANKESIICGWNLIKKELAKNKTEFIPVDSEHFSIYKLVQDQKFETISKVIITASGGPFLNKKNFKKKIKISEALNHPNWKMGKKISIDSSTMMNKIFEVIEAKKIFNLNIKKIDILINPNSYIHAIIVLKDGTIKFLAHETKMDIPIFNSIYESSSQNYYNNEKLNLIKINKINLSKPNIKTFNSLKILKSIPATDSLFETILITANDQLVDMFLNEQIEFKKITYYLQKIINFKIFKKYCKITPKSVDQIYKVRNLVKKFVYNYVNKIND